jgi:hypothetical protein
MDVCVCMSEAVFVLLCAAPSTVVPAEDPELLKRELLALGEELELPERTMPPAHAMTAYGRNDLLRVNPEPHSAPWDHA